MKQSKSNLHTILRAVWDSVCILQYWMAAWLCRVWLTRWHSMSGPLELHSCNNSPCIMLKMANNGAVIDPTQYMTIPSEPLHIATQPISVLFCHLEKATRIRFHCFLGQFQWGCALLRSHSGPYFPEGQLHFKNQGCNMKLKGRCMACNTRKNVSSVYIEPTGFLWIEHF